MAMLKSRASAAAGRRKKVVTYEKRASLAAPRNIFDVPSDDDEPTPRPSAAPTKKGPPKDDEFDIFDVPSSRDKRPNTAPSPVSTQKKRLRERGRVAEPSANDASADPQAPQALPARRREKTPQAVQMPPVESIGRRAVLSTAMATGHGPKQASHTRPAKRREPEHDPKQASHTRSAKRRELEHGPKQASQAESTIEIIEDWDSDDLLKWIQQYRPKLLRGDNLEKFKLLEISGRLFVDQAGNIEFFQNICKLPIGPSVELANLASEMAGTKRIGKQTEDVEMFDAAPLHSLISTSDINQGFLNAVSKWKDFYICARALHDKGEKDIDKVERYNFPKDNRTLDEACEALSNALQDASKTTEANDNAEVKEAVDNLRKAYDAAKSSRVTIRYIDAELPPAPFSPLGMGIQRPLLAQPWMKELIRGFCDKSFPNRLVVIGNPGIGKSVALVGYLLFYLITQGYRVILQSDTTNKGLGYVFDDDGVHEVFHRNALKYMDGKPCCLLVSADGTEVYPSGIFTFCDRIIVVTSPNLLSKQGLKNWMKQTLAKEFVAPRPSCYEVVYLLSQIQKFDSCIVYWMYREWTRDFRRCQSDCEEAISHLEKGTLSEWYREKQQQVTSLIEGMLSCQKLDEMHQIRDTRTGLMIPSALVTMERRNKGNDKYELRFATLRIAQLVAKVQEKWQWTLNWEILNIFLRSPETRVAAGKRFQTMFLRKFRNQDPNTMPRCHMLRSKNGPHPESSSANAANMPWKGLSQEPTPIWISVGNDTNGSLYSKKELKNAIKAVNLNPDDPPAIQFLIPCGQNWASWDAALFIGKHRKGGVDIHIVFLQLTVDPDHAILAKGLDQVKNAIPSNLKGVRINYHYVLVLLTHINNIDGLQIPAWRSVLNNSKERKPDDSWKNLNEYVMFVPVIELAKQPQEG